MSSSAIPAMPPLPDVSGMTGTSSSGTHQGLAHSSWLRTSVIAAGLFVLALIVGGYLASSASGPDSGFASWVSQLGQLAAAGLATAAAAVAVRRHSGVQRRAWLLVTLACGSWTVGQLIWCYFDAVLDGEIPQVSIADPFFLVFTALMAFAVWPSDGRHTDRLRTSLDAFIIGMSLFTISWVTSIHQVAARADESGLLGFSINLAYPCGDVVVLTMVLLGTSRRVDHRSSLAAVAVAMALIAISDGFYAYVSASAEFDSGSVTGLGWTAGFGLIGCAALASGHRQDPPIRSGPTFLTTARPSQPQVRGASMLPYVPLAVALVVVGIDRVNYGTGRLTGLLIVVTFLGVLLRQYLTIRDNGTLTKHLESRERDLQAQAFADQLTGLPNRALFTDRVTHALEQHRRSMRPLALLFVDLDDFKVVNDTLGHPVGDELVIRVAERFLGAIRVSDTVARFGGDEFAVLVEGDSDAIDVGARLVDCLRPAFSLAGEQLSIGASIGIAEVEAGQPTPPLDELYSRADIAMYAAKRSGKGQVALYEPSMVLPEAADLHYRPLLIAAIRAGDIECYFQPIMDLAGGQVHSMEALARWRVGGELVDQGYFIKLTGRLGLLPALTDLMLERACAQLAEWTALLGRGDLQVGVNVPAELMNDPDFPRRVAAALLRHGLGENRLLLEVTEDALLGETAVAGLVAGRLRELGVHLWLDDFGTGYSSLLSLRRIPLQAVKIDIAFVANIHTDPSAERFLRAVLALGRDLDLLVTAEGVECTAQADILRSLGCRFVQGYLYARPAPAAELDHLLHAASASSLTEPGTYVRSAVL
jgi:diguanylate cyclase (GGDEF)-like protein